MLKCTQRVDKIHKMISSCLKEDVDGLDSHDLEDVVRSSQDGVERELDEGTHDVEVFVNLLAN